LANNVNNYELFQSGFTPLHIAAHYGNTAVGRLLIDCGADVNFKARVRIKLLISVFIFLVCNLCFK